jgi:hypothetical protein
MGELVASRPHLVSWYSEVIAVTERRKTSQFLLDLPEEDHLPRTNSVST